MFQFYTVNDQKIDDIYLYVLSYIKDNPDIQIWIGCDSQVFRYKTRYIIAITFYTPKKGGHVLISKEWINTPSFHERIWGEVERCKNICDNIRDYLLENNLKNIIIPSVDISPDPKFKSHVLYNAALGYLKGSGYSMSVGKPSAMAASYIADHYCRG